MMQPSRENALTGRLLRESVSVIRKPKRGLGGFVIDKKRGQYFRVTISGCRGVLRLSAVTSNSVNTFLYGSFYCQWGVETCVPTRRTLTAKYACAGCKSNNWSVTSHDECLTKKLIYLVFFITYRYLFCFAVERYRSISSSFVFMTVTA